MLSLMDIMVSLVVKVLWKLISLICFRVYLEVNVHKNPTCFSRWSVRLWMETSQCVLKALNTLKENEEITKELDETMIELTKVTDKTVEELENLK